VSMGMMERELAYSINWITLQIPINLIVMPIFTAILSSLGTVVALTKKVLELRSTVKDLFKKDIQLNKAFSDLNKKDEKVLIDLYRAIEMGRDLCDRLYKKLAIRYISILILSILLFFGGIYFLQPILHDYPLLSLAFFLSGYFLITGIFPIPFNFSLKVIEQNALKFDNSIRPYKTKFSDRFQPGVYRIRRVLWFIKWMTPSEEKYLQHYLDLCSLRDTLEIYWIDQKIEESKTLLNETSAFRPVLEQTMVDIIEKVINNKKDLTSCKEEIVNLIRDAGYERYLKSLGDDFFNRDFKKGYELDPQNGVLNIIREYLP
jgi:hypothetical protein